ncbi:hypothetical protein CgunFtcFv8_018711 [Champsocephalus gunnari]|uniref:Striated muscle preferentially expressed protein kinase n=1 Tax=Champsocephalus gunnari TaxID=52237 RepID=A0AAN8BTZ7_CHAGU|nr:hypothetical protein CgunFtcFv8_018711 [Champsocephalus gunnari]
MDQQNNVKERKDLQSMNEKNMDEIIEKRTKTQLEKPEEVESDSRSPSVITPIIVIEEDGEEEEEEKKEYPELHINETEAKSQQHAAIRATESPTLPEHPAVFAKVATADRCPSVISTSSNPDLTAAHQPVLRTDIKDIGSEEVFEARFKKRESSLTRGLRKLTRNKSEEKSPLLNRKEGEAGEDVYRPGARGAPVEMVPKGLQEKSKSVQDLREDDKETGLSLIGRFSLRAKRSSSVDKKAEKPKEEKPQEVQEAAVSKRVSWAVGRSKSLDTKTDERKADESSVSAMRRKFESKVAGISAKIRTKSEERKDAGGSQKELVLKDLKKVNDSPVLAMRHKFENQVAGISSKIRSQSEERKEGEEGKKTPLFSRHRHSQSEGRGLKGMGIPENQLAKQTGSAASKESIESTSSMHSEKASEAERRSRWDRWGLRGKKDKTPSQTDLPSSVPKEEGLSKSQQFSRSASDFAPVFHIKLKDHILLEGEPVTLTCLPAGSPPPEITWTIDRKPLVLDDRINLMSHPDGRQLLMIPKSSRRDAGVYECVATNPIAAITTSCTLSIACVPKRPGTPEVPQTYNNTALVLWKPADTKPPCSYTLERKTEGDPNWLTVASGVVDCYYNVTDLPTGGVFRFRIACINKAGQGPYSNCSHPVSLDSKAGGATPAVAVIKTVPTAPEPVVSSSVTVPPPKPVQSMIASTIASTFTSPKEAISPVTSQSITVVTPTPLPSLPSNPPLQSEQISSSLPSPPPVKAPPPFVLPKPLSPVNVVSPMTQSPPMSPLTALVTPPSTPTKPASVPTYAPTTTITARVIPTPVSFSPQVLQASSLSPFSEGASTDTRGTPSGRTTPSTTLRQGVPQKPYTFLDEKARGRFGVIRECRENATGNIYMAKIISYSQETKQDILKEYEILKSLHYGKVMALHEAYVTPRYLVLVAEYCTGKELLYSLIDRFRYSEDDVAGYLVQILQGVEYLHNRRVLHLDLKSDNILVTNLNVIKIVDFGSAQGFNPLSLKQQESGAGTLEYMAPEVVKGEVVGPPADIWTVGVVTHIMLSGHLPFEDKDPLQVESKILLAKFDPTKLYPNVSQSASAFLKKMLSSYPWARSTTRDCFTQAWLQDSYLMKLRRQTLTFTSGRLKEFLVEQQSRRSEAATKHKVMLRTYQGSPKSPAPGTSLQVPSPK